MLKDDILNVIERYYPRGINECYENLKYHQSPQIVRHHFALREASSRFEKEWRDLLSDFRKQQIAYYDFSHLPNPYSDDNYYNDCFHAQFKKHNYIVILLISAFFKSYNLVVIDIAKRAFPIWDSYPVELVGFILNIQDLVVAHYQGYISLPYELLEMKVAEFSVQPFDIGEARVFHYLYTLLPQFEEILWERT